jgi:hypothetical protein
MSLGRGARRAVPGCLVVLAACGGGGPDGYGPEHRAGFVDDCTTDVASEPACECFYDRLAAQVPFERFEELDKASHDQGTGLPADIAALAAGCAAANEPPDAG